MYQKDIKLLCESQKAVINLMITFQLHMKLNTAKYGEGLKILTHKQMLQRLPIALAQVRAGNTSEYLLNEIRQIIFCNLLKKYITIY